MNEQTQEPDYRLEAWHDGILMDIAEITLDAKTARANHTMLGKWIAHLYSKGPDYIKVTNLVQQRLKVDDQLREDAAEQAAS